MHNSYSSTSTDPNQQILLLRDGMLFSLLWQSCLSSVNAGALRLDNIVMPTGESAVPHLVPDLKLQAGAVLHLLPDTTKNMKSGHCNTTVSRDVMCFSTWFQMAVHYHAAEGQPITNCIIRPLGEGTKQFAEKPMTCSHAGHAQQNAGRHGTCIQGRAFTSQRSFRGSSTCKQHIKRQEELLYAMYYTDVHRPARLRVP